MQPEQRLQYAEDYRILIKHIKKLLPGEFFMFHSHRNKIIFDIHAMPQNCALLFEVYEQYGYHYSIEKARKIFRLVEGIFDSNFSTFVEQHESINNIHSVSVSVVFNNEHGFENLGKLINYLKMYPEFVQSCAVSIFCNFSLATESLHTRDEIYNIENEKVRFVENSNKILESIV